MLSKFVRFAALGAVITVPIGAYAFIVRPWQKNWGVDPAEAAKALPGDDLVPEAGAVETRGITIDATPAEVWPWLAQMGYGRGGWYSYDQLDMKGHSTMEILPEWQGLKVGDIVPTHPDGGFEVRLLEPERALALYVEFGDGRAVEATGGGGHGVVRGARPPGVRGDARLDDAQGVRRDDGVRAGADRGRPDPSHRPSKVPFPGAGRGRPRRHGSAGLRRLPHDASPAARHS